MFVGCVRLRVWGIVLVVCVSVSEVLFSVGFCVCDLLIFLQEVLIDALLLSKCDWFIEACN